MFTDYGPIKLSKRLSRRADGCVILQIIEAETGLVVESPTTVAWDEVNGQIVIRHISGLQPGKKYRLRVLVI